MLHTSRAITRPLAGAFTPSDAAIRVRANAVIRRDRFLGQSAGQGDRAPHLIEVVRAAVAWPQVRLEAGALDGRAFRVEIDVAEQRERHAAALALVARLGGVCQDDEAISAAMSAQG